MSRAARRLEPLAQRLAEVCIPRIRIQMGSRRPIISGAAAKGYLRAWANFAVHQVAAVDLLPGLGDADWQQLAELAVQKTVEAEGVSSRRAGSPSRRKAA